MSRIFEEMRKKVSYVLLLAMVIVFAGQADIKAATEAEADATATTPYTYTAKGDVKGWMIPVSFKKAGVYSCKAQVSSNMGADVRLRLMKDENASDILFSTGVSDKGAEFERIITSPVTYYMFVYGENASTTEDKTLTVTWSFKEAEIVGREIKEGEKITAAAGKEKVYFTVKLKSDSQISVTTDRTLGLYDSAKKDMNFSFNEDKKSTYLKKGTYYLGLYNGSADFSFTTSKIKFDNNVTKKKAKAITIGKALKVNFACTAKKNSKRFYKFTLKKAKKITVKADVKECGSTALSIYQKNGDTAPWIYATVEKSGKVAFEGQLKKSGKEFSGAKSVKLPAGTYYVELDNTFGGAAKITIK